MQTQLIACWCKNFKNLHSRARLLGTGPFPGEREGGFSTLLPTSKGTTLLAHRINKGLKMSMSKFTCSQNLSLPPLSLVNHCAAAPQTLTSSSTDGSNMPSSVANSPFSHCHWPATLNTLLTPWNSLFQRPSHFPLAQWLLCLLFSRLFSDPWPLNIDC